MRSASKWGGKVQKREQLVTNHFIGQKWPITMVKGFLTSTSKIKILYYFQIFGALWNVENDIGWTITSPLSPQPHHCSSLQLSAYIQHSSSLKSQQSLTPHSILLLQYYRLTAHSEQNRKTEFICHFLVVLIKAVKKKSTSF